MLIINIENWKDVVGYEGTYQVSDLGNVRSLDRENLRLHKGKIKNVKRKGKVLTGRITHKGYLTVVLYDNGKKHCEPIHRLVIRNFKGIDPNRKYVNHINGIKTDNRLCNLEWCTNSENIIHALKTGLQKRKLNNDDCEQIMKLYKSGNYTQQDLGTMYGVCKQTIQTLIQHGRKCLNE